MPGQRYLQASIEVDGQVALQTGFGVPDSWGKDQTWQRLTVISFELVDAKLATPSAAALKLQGKVTVKLAHSSSAFVTVATDRITLVPDPKNKGRWMITADDVKRLAMSLQ